MMRVGQRTEKRRTAYSPQLSRGHSQWSPSPGGERLGWERLVELNKEPQEDPENPTPQPTSHMESQDSSVPSVISLDR